MVTVVNYALRKTSEGREFYVLILQGGLSLVQSRQTGNWYATIKQTSVPSTFDEATAKSMIGERVPGSVQRKSCDPYEFTSKTTGEIMQMNHRWVYVPEGASVEEAIFEGEPEVVEHNPQASRPLIAAGVR
ncbi:MAG TPA: hypothetical protein PLQ69_01095 [Paludibacter sp.]|nr:hypothetical protein [Paludibacter sp.]